jgi:hypothetical protein
VNTGLTVILFTHTAAPLKHFLLGYQSSNGRLDPAFRYGQVAAPPLT